MRSLLRNIRSKPKAVRNQYALGLAFVFTGAVAFAWVMTGMNLDQKTVHEVAETNRPAFSNLTEQIKEQWATARAAIDGASAEEKATTSAAVVADPLGFTLSAETAAELAAEGRTEPATSTATTSEPWYVIVQIATTSSASTSIASTTGDAR